MSYHLTKFTYENLPRDLRDEINSFLNEVDKNIIKINIKLAQESSPDYMIFL